MSMTPEGKIKKRIKEILNRLGVYWAMPMGTVLSRNGVPDFLCCYKGCFIAIEAKAGGGRTSKLQDYELASINKAGGITIIVNERNIDLLEEVIRVRCEQSDSGK